MLKTTPILLTLFILSTSATGFAEGQSCLTCQFPLTMNSSKPGQANACEDLYGAACVSTDGKLKYNGASKKLAEDLAKPLQEARNKTARAMGFRDIDDAIRVKLKDAGLAVKDSP